jgi:hypothetical protein
MGTSEPLKILVLGGDSSVWVSLSGAMGERASQILVMKDIDPQSLADAYTEMDAVVLVSSGDAEAHDALRHIRAAGLHRRTVVVADPSDSKASASVV